MKESEEARGRPAPPHPPAAAPPTAQGLGPRPPLTRGRGPLQAARPVYHVDDWAFICLLLGRDNLNMVQSFKTKYGKRKYETHTLAIPFSFSFNFSISLSKKTLCSRSWR